jgi:hypothetical protein
MEFKISAAAFTQDSLEQTLSPSKLPNELSLWRHEDEPETSLGGLKLFRYNRMTAMDAARMRMTSTNERIKSFCFVSIFQSQNFLDFDSEKKVLKSFPLTIPKKFFRRAFLDNRHLN